MQIASIVLVVLIALGYLAFWWFGRKPYYHKNQTIENLPKFIGSLVHQMVEESLLFLDADNTVFFLQFKLLRVTQDSSEIEFMFPNATWSRDFFEILKNRLFILGYNPEVVETTDNEAEEIKTVLFVRFSGTRKKLEDQALAIASTAFSVLGLDVKHPLTIHYEGQLDPKRAMKKYIPSVIGDAV
jgi:hypothetical protein